MRISKRTLNTIILVMCVSSLFSESASSSPCVYSKRVSNTESTLHVMHRYGTCSGLSRGNVTSPNHYDLFSLDEARVNYLNSKNLTDGLKTKLPLKHESKLGSGMNYIVTVGIGTPKHEVSLTLDTGSDLTWTQCEPCQLDASKPRSCYEQKETIFKPSLSSSYSKVPCKTPVCSRSLVFATGKAGKCLGSDCIYNISYEDESRSEGFLAKEQFTLTNSDVIKDVYFGCAQVNEGKYGKAAGLLGLGRSQLSFPSQTKTTYKNIFSYCLPSSSDRTGYLTFGSAGISSSVKYTPASTITDDKSLYGLDIVGIKVDNKLLDISSNVFSPSGAAIDSGYVLTHLQPKAYSALQKAFKEALSKYPAASPLTIMDTCFDLSKSKTAVKFPKVAFLFKGDVTVEIDETGIMYENTRSQVCLAFVANSNDKEHAVFGSFQQKRLEVVYDPARKLVGFAPNGCK